MFFQNFFGEFTNDYTDVYDPTQSVNLFVSQNAYQHSYIGNETLPQGVNPFVPQPPTPEPEESISVVWIVVLSLMCALLLGFLGFALYRCKSAQHENSSNR